MKDLELMLRNQEKQSVLACNNLTENYGLTLTEEEVLHLTEYKSECLVRHQRLEFTGGILERIIRTVCTSTYISMDNYVETLEGMLDVYYEFRNSFGPEVGDQEILDLMEERFEKLSEGNFEYLFGDGFVRMEDIMDWREALYQEEVLRQEGWE